MRDRTYELVFYDRDGQVDSEQDYTDRETALEAFRLFDELDNAELYSRIVLQEYDWQTRTETELEVLAF
ncbi:MAG: hypothetical protein IKE25_09805 [Clostridia bacterium]|nr:hypothetical protein [Clostridia bacterium]